MTNPGCIQNSKECMLCGSHAVEIAYDGPMRHSGIGMKYSNSYRVYCCSYCSVEYIHPFPLQGYEDIYVDGKYWGEKGVCSPNDIYKLHHKALSENLLWLEKIKITNLVDRCVLDFGCGSGAFLDLIKGFAKATVGIERNDQMASFAKKRGHQVFSSVQDACAAGVKADVIVSFDTLEHLVNPSFILDALKNVLMDPARLYIGVPNQEDKIKELTPSYLPHFYHVEHLWYFNAKSLKYVIQKTGFQVDFVQYLHKYNFMNLVEWARTGKAPGNPQSLILDADLDLRLRGWLEDRGVSSHVMLEASYAE